MADRSPMVITWGFIAALAWIVVGLLVTGCAASPLDEAFAAVNNRASYAHYTGWDRRVLQAGDKGNCAAFAFSYQAEALARGVPLFVRSCTLRSGEEHAFAMSLDGQALDVRQRWVVPVREVGCQY